MTKIETAFSGGKTLIPFITCGDPSLEITEELVYAMDEAGAGLIELGIPFSDPTAEGTIIEAADFRALSGGATTDRIFDMVRRIRTKTEIPLTFTTYANVAFSYGAEQFIGTAAAIGIDALIFPDIPFEEKEEFAPLCKAHGIDLISLVAPAPRERIKAIAKEAAGFVCCTASPDAADARPGIVTEIGEIAELVKAEKNIPCAAGFDLPTAEQAAVLPESIDGIIAGAAVVKICETYGAGCVPHAADYVRSIKKALIGKR